MEKQFKNLPISTQTVMAYLTCSFNINNIFKGLQITPTDIPNMKKIVGKHGDIYQIKKAGEMRGFQSKRKKNKNFRNQITTYIYIIDKMITIKIFPTGKFHLTGCKTFEHQKEACLELTRQIEAIHTSENPTIIWAEDKERTITLEVVMVNVDFHLDFTVDQKKLDYLIQSSTSDFYSIYDTAVNTSVNIKLDYPEPEEKEYNQLVLFPNNIVKVNKVSECVGAKVKAKRKHTFLVFSSSKVIQSGRYYDTEMEKVYIKFMDFINQHRKDIQLNLQHTQFDISTLKGLRTPLQIKVI